MASREPAGVLGRLGGVALLLALGWLVLAAGAAPLPRGGGLPHGPDLLLCVAAFWAVRRPREAPAAAIFALGLARDLVAGGPLGAGALGLLAATEALRAQGPLLRRRGLVLEWGAAAGAAALSLLVSAALVAASLAPAPDAGPLVAAWGATAIAYGPAALLLRHGLRLSTRADPADGDAMFGRSPR